MIPIHEAAGKDPSRPAFGYMQVRKGTCIATDSVLALMLPAYLVFDGYNMTGLVEESTIIHEDDVFYIDLIHWKLQRFDKAHSITRDPDNPLIFYAFDKKGTQIGMIKALAEPEFEKEVSRYPDVSVVFPNAESVPVALDTISFNPLLLAKVANAWGAKDGKEFGFYYTFYGDNKAFHVRHTVLPGEAMVFPTFVAPDIKKKAALELRTNLRINELEHLGFQVNSFNTYELGEHRITSEVLENASDARWKEILTENLELDFEPEEEMAAAIGEEEDWLN